MSGWTQALMSVLIILCNEPFKQHKLCSLLSAPPMHNEHTHAHTYICTHTNTHIHWVGQNHTFISIYSVQCTYGISSRGITIHTVIYGADIRFWPTLHTNIHSHTHSAYTHTCTHKHAHAHSTYSTHIHTPDTHTFTLQEPASKATTHQSMYSLPTSAGSAQSGSDPAFQHCLPRSLAQISMLPALQV